MRELSGDEPPDLQATAVTDRWGPVSYGTLNGLLTAPALVASAAAPFAGALMADVLGSYARAFLVLAGLAGVASVPMVGTAPAARSGAGTSPGVVPSAAD